MKNILGIIGKVGKGLATPVAGVLAGSGVVLGGAPDVVDCLKHLLASPDTAVLTTGLTGLVFGIARKAGWVGKAQEGL